MQAAVLIAITALQGGFFWRNNTGTFRSMDGKRIVKAAIPGSPDILGCYRSHAIGIECKSATGRQREDQARFEKLWNRAGGVYVLARGPRDALDALAAL